MKNIIQISLLLLFISYSSDAQIPCGNEIGSFASGIQLDGGTTTMYNVTGVGMDQINPGGPDFSGQNFGAFNVGDNLRITAGEIKVFGTDTGNVCSATLHYRVYLTGATTPPTFSNLMLSTPVECDAGAFADGFGSCNSGDQKWKNYGLTTNILDGLCEGDYTIEIYFSFTGDDCNSAGCDQTEYINNSENNYKAFFTINPIANPMATSPQSFCDNAIINDLTATGSNLQWYSAATGGVPLVGSTSLSDGQTVYVSQTIICESDRIPVEIEIIPTPNTTGIDY